MQAFNAGEQPALPPAIGPGGDLRLRRVVVLRGLATLAVGTYTR